MNVSDAKVKLEIDFESADKIVLAVLKEDYRMVRGNIMALDKLIKQDKVKSYVIEDLEYDKKLLKALKKVLAYYMVHEEYQKFIEENK
jgi:hypothetical protein